jgi:hypothetical protein
MKNAFDAAEVMSGNNVVAEHASAIKPPMLSAGRFDDGECDHLALFGW